MRKLLISLALFFCATGLRAQLRAPIRIHCGGADYIDSNGNTWQTDANFAGGIGYFQGVAVTGTKDSPLFNFIRYAVQGSKFVYTFPIPNGAYIVNLSFAELWQNHRDISVLINGVVVLAHFDVFAKVGNAAADIERTTVTVTTGSLTIEVDSFNGNGYVDAIEILQAGPLKIAFPGCCTVTFPIANASQVPSCTPADGACSIAIQICDGTNPPNCLTSKVGTMSLVKTITLPTPQTQTVPVAVAGP